MFIACCYTFLSRSVNIECVSGCVCVRNVCLVDQSTINQTQFAAYFTAHGIGRGKWQSEGARGLISSQAAALR